jgi:hypothetical protein
MAPTWYVYVAFAWLVFGYAALTYYIYTLVPDGAPFHYWDIALATFAG